MVSPPIFVREKLIGKCAKMEQQNEREGASL